MATTTAPGATGRSTGLRWRLLVLLMATTFASQFNRICMPVAGDLRIMERHAIDPVAMGTVYSAFLLGYTLFMIPGGRLIDRIGPCRALTAMGLGTALFAAMTGWAGRAIAAGGALWWALIAIRGLMGACAAPTFPAAAAFVHRAFPGRWRGMANGLIVGAAPLGVAMAYPIFSRLVLRFDWPDAFLIAAASTGALALLWWLMAGDGRGAYPADDEFPEARAAGGMRGWRWILSDRGLLLVTASYTAVGYFDFLFFYWMDYYFRTVLALADAAWYASLPPLAMTAGIPLGGWISDGLARRYGAQARGWVAAGGMVLSAAFLLGGVFAATPGAIAAWFALALGTIGMSESTFWVVAVERGGDRGGTAAGFMNTGGNIGGMIAPVVTPWVGLHLGWSAAIGLGGLVGLLGAACWLFMPPESRHPDASDDPSIESRTDETGRPALVDR